MKTLGTMIIVAAIGCAPLADATAAAIGVGNFMLKLVRVGTTPVVLLTGMATVEQICSGKDAPAECYIEIETPKGTVRLKMSPADKALLDDMLDDD